MVRFKKKGNFRTPFFADFIVNLIGVWVVHRHYHKFVNNDSNNTQFHMCIPEGWRKWLSVVLISLFSTKNRNHRTCSRWLPYRSMHSLKRLMQVSITLLHCSIGIAWVCLPIEYFMLLPSWWFSATICCLRCPHK